MDGFGKPNPDIEQAEAAAQAPEKAIRDEHA